MKFLSIACFLLPVLYTTAQVSSEKYNKVSKKVDFVRTPSSPMVYGDHLGNRIDLIIKNSIEAQDPEELVAPFRTRKETRLWQTEFWGKWMLSAAKAYQYTGDARLYDSMKSSVYGIMATQSGDGYIGNYAPGYHLKAWDVWGRKYTMLGLLYFYDLSGDAKVLDAAARLADQLMTEVGPGKANIVLTGVFRGMNSCSVLEPIMLLYERTGKTSYLKFAQYIVGQWETPDGPQLISKALAGIPVAERFPVKENWWTWENGQKAYEMMSCYDGLLKLYQHTGTQQYLDAVYAAVKNIQEEEINIVGSGASMECWYHGNSQQIYPAAHGMETCVTITWMKLCYELYRLTGESKFVEEIEKTAYNDLLGSMTPDGVFSKYSALQGFRSLDGFQCGMKLNCCMANGPRGLVLLPDVGVMTNKDQVYINLYNAGKAKVLLPDGTELGVTIESEYPKNGAIKIRTGCKENKSFSMLLRIPSWSSDYKVTVNGEVISTAPSDKGYLELKRVWKPGDEILLSLDMKGRILIRHNGIQTYRAFVRGPIVLARDSRFSEVPVDAEIASITEVKGIVEMKDVKLKDAWMAYLVKFRYGPGESTKEVEVPFVDFSSAGNQWSAEDRYRVWIPEIFDPIRALAR